MSELDSVLIDTSTLINLGLDDYEYRPTWSSEGAGAIEALVLFERIVLDSPSIGAGDSNREWDTDRARRNLRSILSIDDLGASVRYANSDPEEARETYRRAATLVGEIELTAQDVARIAYHVPDGMAQEIGAHFRSSSSWENVAFVMGDDDLLQHMVTEFRLRLGSGSSFSAGGVLVLIRLFYYLALQERLGSPALLLHPSKGIFDAPPGYAHARSIFDMFDARVRDAYHERRRNWLGTAKDPELPLPALARYVAEESHRREWSPGRTIAHLREDPDVRSFRKGMKELCAYVEMKDAVKIDSVLGELESAATEWSKKLGVKIRPRRLSLQLALPFVQPSFDVPLPLPATSPAQRLLLLIDRLMREG